MEKDTGLVNHSEATEILSKGMYQINFETKDWSETRKLIIE